MRIRDLLKLLNPVRRSKVLGKWVDESRLGKPESANMFVCNISLSEFQLLFCISNFVNDDAEPVALLSLTPQRVVELRNLLSNSISRYEEAFGTIVLPPSGSTNDPPVNVH